MLRDADAKAKVMAEEAEQDAKAAAAEKEEAEAPYRTPSRAKLLRHYSLEWGGEKVKGGTAAR